MQLKPHTKKWFAAFARFNPWQAALTMALLQTARTNDVCSFCGTGPAGVYELMKDCTSPGTFRLCDNCVDVRKRSFGENFMSVPKTVRTHSTTYLNQRQTLAVS